MRHVRCCSADTGNLLGSNLDTIRKNKQALIDVSKEVGPEVNTEKTKCMFMTRRQNAKQIHKVKTASR
jgi:hypothetical protein